MTGAVIGGAAEHAAQADDAVLIYRVSAAKDADDGFTRPQQRDGRWTTRSASVGYAASSAAAAVLEFLAHLEGATEPDLRLLVGAVPRALVETLESPPARWRERPYRADVQRVGDDWAASGRSLALRVPSALCPRESNLLLNTSHVLATRIAVLACEALTIDARLRT